MLLKVAEKVAEREIASQASCLLWAGCLLVIMPVVAMMARR